MYTAGHSLNAYTTDNMLFQRLTQGNLTIYVLHIIHFRPEQSHVLPRHGHFYFRAYTNLEERGGFVIGLSRLWVNHASGMLGSCAFFGIGHKTGAHCWHHSLEHGLPPSVASVGCTKRAFRTGKLMFHRASQGIYLFQIAHCNNKTLSQVLASDYSDI